MPPNCFNEDGALEEAERVVLALYDALQWRDAVTVQQILAPDLEWWFHGPPSHQFLMRLLTGSPSAAVDTFQFVPHSVTSFGSTVLSEGCDPTGSITWVHAWTVSDGIITQVKEYFNTSLTVTRIGESSNSTRASSPLDSAGIAPRQVRKCSSVWESSLSNRGGKSVPGLVLAL
ncbi:hypothetical protein SAY87_006839 [Trapa incisa]|uniref:Wound-induced protein 1 n=1 Tax=Trapa incisa TaxID=236973 RepID=A0AAN7K1S9_9MYRT|nr:hypothetical protein SAY87_006839 [Trapa incisa]